MEKTRMNTPLKMVSLAELCRCSVMFDANIFMVGLEKRGNNPDYSFANMKAVYLIPLFESFEHIIIHQMVYDELDAEAKAMVDSYKEKNVFLVQEGDLFGKDPQYTFLFNKIANHERVQYTRGNSKDRGEVYSLAYAAFYKINFLSSKEIMVDEIVKEMPELKEIKVITFDVIVLLAYVYHMSQGDTSKNKALKSIYKRYCEDVIRRHHLPPTLKEYVEQSQSYIAGSANVSEEV